MLLHPIKTETTTFKTKKSSATKVARIGRRGKSKNDEAKQQMTVTTQRIGTSDGIGWFKTFFNNTKKISDGKKATKSASPRNTLFSGSPGGIMFGSSFIGRVGHSMFASANPE
ncbi:MAG TPA: hypothetical protein VFC44_21140 [Candidatus Saccharimonadales bacterium]|nr:hypothetical protein [Candidatus Saccharimonadales bacterium]